MKEKKWIIAVICFLITFLIVVQARTIRENSTDILLLKKENELRDEINQWKDTYAAANEKIEELTAKVTEYQNATMEDDKAVSLIKSELETANMRAGLTKLKGQGLVITLDDTRIIEKIAIDAGYYDPNVFVIHDSDLLLVVNELIASGAEAVSINNQRITSFSEIRCVGPQININGIRMSAPFEIVAIGDATSLVGALSLRGGIIDNIKAAEIDVTIEKKDEVIVPEYSRAFLYKYATKLEEGKK